MLRSSKLMKGRGFTKTFPLIYVPSVINRFIFRHWVVIYFIKFAIITQKKKKQKLTLFSCWARKSAVCYLICQEPQQLLRKEILWNLLFADTFCCKTKLKSHFFSCNLVSKCHQMTSHNALLLMPLALYIVIFMQPLYQAVILCDYII